MNLKYKFPKLYLALFSMVTKRTLVTDNEICYSIIAFINKLLAQWNNYKKKITTTDKQCVCVYTYGSLTLVKERKAYTHFSNI